MARPPKKKLSPKARKEAVELAIREHGWDHALAVRLAAETGWSWRTMYRDRDAVVATLATEDEEALPRQRAAFLRDVRALRTEAKRNKKFSAAAKLLGMEVGVLGLDRVPLPVLPGDEGPVDASLEVVLGDVRRMRRQAEAGHSYVAAERLLAREVELVGAIARRDEERAKAQRADMTLDELVDALEVAATSLPAPIRARLLRALGA